MKYYGIYYKYHEVLRNTLQVSLSVTEYTTLVMKCYEYITLVMKCYEYTTSIIKC